MGFFSLLCQFFLKEFQNTAESPPPISALAFSFPFFNGSFRLFCISSLSEGGVDFPPSHNSYVLAPSRSWLSFSSHHTCDSLFQSLLPSLRMGKEARTRKGRKKSWDRMENREGTDNGGTVLPPPWLTAGEGVGLGPNKDMVA